MESIENFASAVAVGEGVRFDGQVVLVTGAGRGLGRAYAATLARLGAQVVVNDTGVERDGRGGNPAVAAAVVREIQEQGGSAVASSDDVGDVAGCDALVVRVLAQFGRIDALVHNAGVVAFGPIEETDDAAWERMTRVNIEAPFRLCRAAWPAFRRQRYGRVVLTVSGVALSVGRAMPDLAAYSAGKASQFGLMNALAAEGAPQGILVNAISPVAATRMSREPDPAGAQTPECVAPAVAFLASRRCALTGVVVRVAGSTIATGSFVYAPELDLGAGPASPEAIAALIPRLLERRQRR
jgi:NAD(P)-dependent dehydrogenase (short-subunit alcohol dehydrogenase family)